MITLIIGLRGCGKSTKARELIEKGGLAYDMDAIASAFRLKQPHEEYYPQARKMANDLFIGFIHAAPHYHENIVIIRTAPTIYELEEIKPDLIIFKRTNYIDRQMDDKEAARARISRVLRYATQKNIKVITE